MSCPVSADEFSQFFLFAYFFVFQAAKIEDDARTSSATKEALGNGVILRQIFHHLQTKSLLSSCSFVNQIWSSEATFIVQNYRECRAVQPKGSNSCEFLRDVDKWIGEMERIKRKIALNGLEITAGGRGTAECSVTPSSLERPWMNFKNKNHFTLRYLVEHDSVWTREDRHRPFATLIRHFGEKIQSLAIDNPRLLFPFPEEDSQQPDLPQLKVLNLRGMTILREFGAMEKEALRKLLNGAPNLKKILAYEVEQLRLIPKEKLATLVLELPRELDFRMKKNEDMDVINIISEKGSDIERLSIYVPPFHGQLDEDEWSQEEIVGPELRQSFDLACHRLLRNCCHTSLTELSIHGVP